MKTATPSPLQNFFGALDMSFFDQVLLTFAAAGTSLISGVVGMAGGVTLLAIMTFFLDWQELIPIHGVVQLVSNSSRAFFLRNHIIKSILFHFLIGIPFGVGFAIFLVKELSSKSTPLVFITILIGYVLLKPKKLPPIKIPPIGYIFVGIVSGFLGILVGATGPFLAAFFVRDDYDKEQIVATKAALQLSTHMLKIPAFLYLGFNYINYLPLITVMSFAAIMGTRLGVHILGKTSDRLFRILYQIALATAALRLLYKILI